MPLTTIPLPFGMRDIKLYPLTGANNETQGTAVDLPNSRTLSFSEAEDFEELRGDDGLVAAHGSGPTIDWSLEGGGISLEAVAVMYGGTVSETGVTPNIIKTYNKKSADARPYFRVVGMAISDSGGDFNVIIYKAKATGELSGEMADGSFWLTGASGAAFPLVTAITGPPAVAAGTLYEFKQRETAATEAFVPVAP